MPENKGQVLLLKFSEATQVLLRGDVVGSDFENRVEKLFRKIYRNAFSEEQSETEVLLEEFQSLAQEYYSESEKLGALIAANYYISKGVH